MSADFAPTARWNILQWRAGLLAAARSHFNDHGYYEVETPLLSADIVVDAWLEPFVAPWLPEPQRWQKMGSDRYLQTSPEFAMKRLLAAGATAIYQLGKVFRNGEVGRRHNPEFTMAEWYRVGDTDVEQRQFTESLVRAVLVAACESGSRFDLSPSTRASQLLDDGPFRCLAYDDAFRDILGVSVLGMSTAELARLASQRQLTPPPGLSADDRDGWLNFLLAELIEPRLGFDGPVFLHEYPASQAALARTHHNAAGHEVAARFELYVDGVELCNGYYELLDAGTLRARNREQNQLRIPAGLRPLPEESRLLAAMEHGLPECAGVALGFDRLVMLALGTTDIADVIAFPFDRA